MLLADFYSMMPDKKAALWYPMVGVSPDIEKLRAKLFCRQNDAAVWDKSERLRRDWVISEIVRDIARSINIHHRSCPTALVEATSCHAIRPLITPCPSTAITSSQDIPFVSELPIRAASSQATSLPIRSHVRLHALLVLRRKLIVPGPRVFSGSAARTLS